MVLSVVIDKRETGNQKAKHGTWSGEAVAFCPRCKALQTIWITGGILMSTRKYYQVGDRVYHDCGSSQHCRLYCSL